ncbi:sodium:calcium antiporter [[Pseudomonas] boreopolis]|uniref:Sodium:calcium antiporter n=1 Tax=Xanthomonas boreopolis TaxID=86183 RepID=A0A919F914_9XANT|nr:sodium:calcium antiporter [[Pseudomonas] boreopolis]
MAAAIAWLVLGLVLLGLGGDSIIKAASGLAQRWGASSFMAGLLLVAFGTSLPELAVNVRAFMVGAQELALGNAVGSNIANVGLTLALAALAAPLLLGMRLLAPLLVVLVVASLALIGFGLDGAIGRIEGLAMLAGFAGVLAFLVRRARRESDGVQAAVGGYAVTRTGLGLNLQRLAIALLLLGFGARWVVDSAVALGGIWGWSPLLMGLLPVAIGTALPEAAAAIAAARRGQGDMVAGHVIGSSVFNLLVVVGGMAALRPLPLPASFVRLELPAAIVLALMLYPMLRGDLRVSRGEGAVLLAAFCGWIGLELALAA